MLITYSRSGILHRRSVAEILGEQQRCRLFFYGDETAETMLGLGSMEENGRRMEIVGAGTYG